MDKIRSTSNGRKMARIAFLIPDMGGGGAEKVALSLLQDFSDSGNEVDLILMQRKGAFLSHVPKEVRIIDLAAPRLRHALYPLIRYLRRERPDAIQISMWPLTIVGILAVWLAGTQTRIVTSEHSTLSRQYAGRRRTLRFLRWSTRLFYPRAKAVIAVSKGAADDLAALSGLPRDRITVVPNPVPVPQFDPDEDEMIEHNWRGAKHRILSVGSFKPEKNFALLLEALAAIKTTGDWHAIILGDGPLRTSLEAQVVRLGLADHVSLPGFISDPSPWYSTATHFVLSSTFEGLGNVIIEALHAGLTVVSTDCESGPREILGEGGGKLVPVGDTFALAEAISVSLSAPADRAHQKALGRIWSGESSANQYLKLMGVAATGVGPNQN